MFRTDGRMQVAERAGWSRARKTETYRAWKRNNAIKWFGVTPDYKIEHRELLRQVSKRGEVHYV